MNHLAELIDLVQCPRLTEKYDGIVALPLALPRFELDSADDFWKVWHDEQEAVTRQHVDRGALGRASPDANLIQWDGLAMYEDLSLLAKAAWFTKVSLELSNSQPMFLKSIFEQLPFTKIRSIRFWSANKSIPAHYDGNMPSTLDGKLQFPAEIRIMIDDKNPTETFWLCSSEKYKPSAETVVETQDRYYVKLPNDTNAFAWNNENYLHGADYNPLYRKVLAVVKGWIDVSKLEVLLDASIEKYPDFILRENK
ncbi:hypothetical protein UFOVP71_411 [uncultured Caudovirales phage]|uniref:Uncharacterized protein n=1 Tax=uncultured Caudovirales phage TaxID=2100421 RepID=A0A6J5TAP8_9CAUD|nr:hypothetical protein UFOVP71_411 [uncultured Caudovirales phage]